jgi:allophanate hydrolase subunit 2
VHASVRIETDHFKKREIAVQRGPEFEMLSPRQCQFIFENDFQVSAKNSRMGYQLDGTKINIENSFNMLTAVTIPGTVQLTPAGNPIVLMRDCQTTGGYPRILQLTEEGINRLAQKKTNDLIRFQLQDITE